MMKFMKAFFTSSFAVMLLFMNSAVILGAPDHNIEPTSTPVVVVLSTPDETIELTSISQIVEKF